MTAPSENKMQSENSNETDEMRKETKESGEYKMQPENSNEITKETEESDFVNVKHVSRWAKIWQYLKIITVEPSTFLYIFTWSLQWPAEYAIIYDTLCQIRFGKDSFICSNLDNETLAEEENMVQSDAAQWNLYGSICVQLPPVILTFIYGTVSDRYSRKLVLLIPLFCVATESALYVLFLIVPDMSLEFYLVGKTVNGLGGSWHTFLMAAQSYVTCVSTDENDRVIRIAVVCAMWPFAVAISYFIGGIMLDNTSYLFVFSFSFGLRSIAILNVVICIKDFKGKSSREKNSGRCGWFKDILLELKDGVKSIMKKRPKHGRLHLVVLILLMMVILFGFAGRYISNLRYS